MARSAAQIRAFGIELCDACIAFVRQVLRGRIMIKHDPINRQFRRLEHERDLYAVVTAYRDLLEATLDRQAQSHAILPHKLPQLHTPVLTLGC